MSITSRRRGSGIEGSGCGGHLFASDSGGAMDAKRSPLEDRSEGSDHARIELGSGEEYWISGPKRNGADSLYATNIPVSIDEDAREEYWIKIRRKPEQPTK